MAAENATAAGDIAATEDVTATGDVMSLSKTLASLYMYVTGMRLSKQSEAFIIYIVPPHAQSHDARNPDTIIA